MLEVKVTQGIGMDEHIHVVLQLHTLLLKAQVTPALQNFRVQQVALDLRHDLDPLIVPAVELAAIDKLFLHR